MFRKWWAAISGWFKRHQSDLIAGGLMLASSGLDGLYMALWMPPGWGWLGLVLNTMADVTDLYLGKRVGTFLRSSDGIKRWGALAIFGGQLVAIAYSWFFSYRQLLRVLPAIEPEHYEQIALWAAGFIPLLLAILGIESGLSSFSSKRFFAESEMETAKIASVPAMLRCEHTGCGFEAGTQQALNAHQRVHSGNGHKVRVTEGVR
jgi:hypothetical protein